MALFALGFAVCLAAWGMVAVNYDMNDYLPPDSPSTVAVNVMADEFGGGIPNARVMIPDVTVPQALEYKKSIAAVDGVLGVTWLDDAVDVTVPLATVDSAVLETYYRDGTALLSVTVDEERCIDAIPAIRAIVGDGAAMSGSAVSTAVATTSTLAEIHVIAVGGIAFALVVLLLTMTSWLEPVLVLGGLGVAVVINAGTNLIFREISFVTNAAGNILQLAVSLDYSVFLIHRFDECRLLTDDREEAMVNALCLSASSIVSSGLTTVIGFVALALMRFRIGPDLGLALAKGVAISLVTVFLFMPSVLLGCCKAVDKTRHRSFMPSFDRFGRAVRRMAIPMVCLFLLIIAPVYLASNANDYYYGASHIFGPDTQLGSDMDAIRQVFGESDTYVLLVPKGDTATQTALSRDLHGLDHVTGVISYVDSAGAEVPMEYLDAATLDQLESDEHSRMVISVDVPYEGKETFALVEAVRAAAERYYPGAYYLAGEGVSTYDLMDTVTADMVKVNLLAIGAVFLVLLLTMRSLVLPVILVLSIETAIWLNLAVPYFTDKPIFYITYLIISAIQLGATVDYAILLTDRYRENRLRMDRKTAVVRTVSGVTVSILTSGSVLTVVGLLMGAVSTNQLLAQLGLLLGRGAIFSVVIVIFVLPGLLAAFDRLILRRGGKGPAKEQTSLEEGPSENETQELPEADRADPDGDGGDAVPDAGGAGGGAKHLQRGGGVRQSGRDRRGGADQRGKHLRPGAGR